MEVSDKVHTQNFDVAIDQHKIHFTSTIKYNYGKYATTTRES